jgi:hypothetical protein
MREIPGNFCDMCGRAPAVAHLEFLYELPETRQQKYEGAPAIRMDVVLCPTCAASAYKHLKRFFGKKYFQSTTNGSPDRG